MDKSVLFRSIKLINEYTKVMTKTISDFAIAAILQDSELFTEVAKCLEVKPQSLTSMLSKKKRARPRRFLEYDCIMTVSNKTGVKPDLLIEREYA